MSEEYSRGVLRVCLAQICQNLGWHSTQSTPLELLTDVLERYLFQLGKVTHRYSEQFGRTDPNLDDVALAFRHLDINLSELEEYVNHVEPLPFAHDIVEFPAPKPCNLRFPNPDSKELQTREDHIPSYMPLMYPEEEGEVEHQPEIAENLVSSNENPSQETPTVIALVSPLPGDKRILTSPPDTIPMKKRARLSSTCLPEEAAHSQYEMKAVIITVSGELTPTKGGKLPDARTPPPGFSKTMYDKEHFVMKKKGGKVEIPFVPKVPPVKLDRETPSKPESKKTEEIIIYPDGSSKKVLKSKSEGFVHKDKSFSHKKVHKMPFSSSSTHKSSKLWTPNSSKAKKKGGRPVGRPRSRSKSPRGGSKSPSRAKSPAQASGSPRGRGRPPKDKSLLKTPEKKPTVKAPYTAPTVEEIFTGEGVLDLSVSSKKKQEETVSHEPVVIKPEETEVNSVPLDLSTHKEEEVKSTSNAEISEPINVPHPRPRGRPPISPEKKRARELAIAASIDAVVDRNREELKREELEKEKGDTAKETEEKDSVKDMDELKKSDILMETYSEPSVKIEVKDTKPSQGHQNLDLPNEAVEIKQETVETDNKSPVLQPVSADLKKKKKKNKDKNEDQVKEKLKEKLKMKENNAKEIKQEILIDNKESENLPVVSDLSQVQEQSTGVFDFAPSPKKTEEIKTEPVKLFTVDFADCNKEGEHGRERSKDKERSKEHKKEKKEKKKDKEKKKKKDKFRDKEKKKEKSGDYPTEYPTVSKLKIRLGSTPSASTVNVMDLPKASPIHEIVSPKDSPSARPELKLVIKALPPLASQDRESPSSTPKHSHKEKDRSKKESKQEKKEKKEREQREKEMKEKELQEQKEMELKEAEMQRLQAIQERKEQEEKERKEKEMKERELQEKLQREQQQRENERWEEIRKNTKPLLLVETPVASRSQGPLRAPTPTVESPPPKSPSPDARISFTPSPSPSSQSTRKTFTPSPSNSPHRSSSPMRSLRDSQSQSPTRIKSRSQSPIHTPSPSRTPSPGPSPIPSPLPLRPSVSPTPTKPTTPSISPEHSPTPSPRPAAPREEIIPPIPPPSICVPPVVKPSVQRTVTVETVTTFIDESGAKVWICPACKMPDDGSPMIGCDICDDWYHWPCVNLKESPPEDEPWYCVRCMPSKQKVAKRGRGRGRGRGTGRGRKKSLL